MLRFATIQGYNSRHERDDPASRFNLSAGNLIWTVLMIWANVHYIRKSKKPGMTTLAALGGMIGIVASIVGLGLLLGWPPGAMGTMSGLLMFLGGAAAAQYHSKRTEEKTLTATQK